MIVTPFFFSLNSCLFTSCCFLERGSLFSFLGVGGGVLIPFPFLCVLVLLLFLLLILLLFLFQVSLISRV